MSKRKGTQYGTPEGEYLETTVKNCARCGGTHKLKFKQFTESGITCNGLAHDWWAMCPDTNEPIIMRFVEVDNDLA